MWPDVGKFRSGSAGLICASLSIVLLTGALAPFRTDVGLLNSGLLFLLLTLLVSAFWGRRVGLYTALLANLALNFFFIEPLHEFQVADVTNIVALVVFLAVSVIGGTLLAMATEAAERARRRQAETEVALRLSRAMSGQTEPALALHTLCREVVESFAAPGAAVLTPAPGGWRVLASDGAADSGRPADPAERAAADEAAASGRIEGLGVTGLGDRRPPRIVVRHGRETAYRRERSVAIVPLKLGDRVIGVLRVDGPIGESPFRAEPEALLNAVAGEAALAVQRAELAADAAHTRALREADEMKSALMASISHDLKTPLAGIKAAITSILDENIHWSDDDLRAFHATIDSQADRLNRVISDILDLNRIEAGAVTPEASAVSAHDLLSEARAATRLVTVDRGVTIDAPGELWLRADPALITQAVVNLIENAAKYSTPGRAIHLGAAAAGRDIEIQVADEGPGIAPQDQPYIFERFYRAEEHSRRVKGSGLGLTIVKGFVELCGGKISVESSPRGTRFIIRLPAAASQKVSA